jgi:hypothetical protein
MLFLLTPFVERACVIIFEACLQACQWRSGMRESMNGVSVSIALRHGGFSLNGPMLAPAKIDLPCAATFNWLY